MMNLVFHELAERDLEEIADYTRSIWGIRQAERYAEGFQKVFDVITQSPESGRKYRRRGSHIRIMRNGSHFVYYIPSGTTVAVGRVLHVSMLPGKHLPAEEDWMNYTTHCE